MLSYIPDLLKYGVYGMGIFAIYHSYRLLAAEQKRPGIPRTQILGSIKSFMWFTLLAICVTGVIDGLEKWGRSNGNSSSFEPSGTVTKADAPSPALAAAIRERDSTKAALEEMRAERDNVLRRMTDQTKESKALADKLSEDLMSVSREGAMKLEATTAKLEEVRQQLLKSEGQREMLTQTRDTLQRDLKSRDRTIESIRSRLEPLSKMDGNSPTSMMFMLGTAVIGIAGDLKQYGAVVLDSENLQIPAADGSASSKATYQNTATLPLGHVFVDKLTGVAVIVKSISPTDHTLVGDVTLPDGMHRNPYFYPASRFVWNRRNFVVAASRGLQQGTFQVSVQETLESDSTVSNLDPK